MEQEKISYAVDGYDFKGLDACSARVRMPRLEEFPKLLDAIKEINDLPLP